MTYHARCTGSFHKSWHKFSLFLPPRVASLPFPFLILSFLLFQNFNTSSFGLIELFNFNVWRGGQRSTTAWTRFWRSLKELARSPKRERSQRGCSQWEGCGGRATSGHVCSPLLSPRLPSNRLSDRPGCKVMPRLQRRSCT